MRIIFAIAITLTLVLAWPLLGLLGFGEYRLAWKPASHYFPDENVEALAKAAAEGDVPAMKKAVAAGADVNYAGFEDIRPLFWAFSAHNKEGLQALLDLGADPYLEADDSFSLVNIAAGADDPDYLRILLDHGLDPNVPVGHTSDPPIFEAIMQRRKPQLEMLLEHCYNLNWVDDYGITAAGTAISIGDIETTYHLVEQGLAHNLLDIAQSIERRTSSDPERAEYREKLMRLLEEQHGISFPTPDYTPGVYPPPSPPIYAQSCLERRAKLGLEAPGAPSN